MGEFQTGHRRGNPIPWTTVALAAVAALAPVLLMRTFGLYASAGDEGVLLCGAMRVGAGQVPFRDFASVIPPGSFYLLALAFRSLGETLFAARSLLLVNHALLLALFLAVCLRLGIGSRGQAVGLVAMVACGPNLWFVVSHHWLANALVLVSALLLLRWGGGGNRGWLAASGAAAGCAGLVLQDQGGYWALFALFAVAGVSQGRRWTDAGAFAAGVLAAAAPLVSYLAWAGALPQAWHFLVAAPLEGYGKINNQPLASGLLGGWEYFRRAGESGGAAALAQGSYGIARQVGDLAVLLSYPLGIAALARALRRCGARSLEPLVLAGLLGSSLLTALHRPAMLNLTWGFFAPLLAVLAAASGRLPRLTGARRTALAAAVSLPFLVMAVCDDLVFPFLSPGVPVETRVGALEVVPSDAPTVRFLDDLRRQMAASGSRVFCYSYCPAFYFLLGAGNPTAFDTYALTPEDGHVMAGQAEAARPEWVLWDGHREERDPVADWIQRDYRLVAQVQGVGLYTHR